jgi:hypothetical protein
MTSASLANAIKSIEEKKHIAEQLGVPLGQLLSEWDGDVPRVARHLFECDASGRPTCPRHRAWVMTAVTWKMVMDCYATWFGLRALEALYNMWGELVDALLICGLDDQDDHFRAWVYGVTCKFGLMVNQQKKKAAVPAYDPENPGNLSY